MIRPQTRIVIGSSPAVLPCPAYFDICKEQEEAFDLGCSVRSPRLEIPQGAQRAFSFVLPAIKTLTGAEEIIFRVYEKNVDGQLMHSALLSAGEILLPLPYKARTIISGEISKDFRAGSNYYELWVVDSLSSPYLGLAGEFFVQDTREYD